MMRILFFLLVTIFFTATTVHVHAHVPYIEWTDFSEEEPFYIKDSIENSKAVYAWFETGEDIDIYTFEVDEPVRLLVNSLVPACRGYEQLLPWIAVIGAGVPYIERELPFKVPEG